MLRLPHLCLTPTLSRLLPCCHAQPHHHLSSTPPPTPVTGKRGTPRPCGALPRRTGPEHLRRRRNLSKKPTGQGASWDGSGLRKVAESGYLWNSHLCTRQAPWKRVAPSVHSVGTVLTRSIKTGATSGLSPTLASSCCWINSLLRTHRGVFSLGHGVW